MEGTIGYEALFSPEDWNAITTSDYREIDKQAHEQFEGGGHETSISAGRAFGSALPEGDFAAGQKRTPASKLRGT